MQFALLFTLFAFQASSCPDENAALAQAAARVNVFEVSGAVTHLERESARGCEQSQIAAVYLRGFIAARQAYSQGGSPASLRPVRDAIADLEARAKSGSRPAEIAALVLLAAASAAQSERDEMAVFLVHALATESLQLAAGVSGAPITTAHDAAGDLWLQVHQFDRARDAYYQAIERMGAKPRLTLGLARVAARLKERSTSCIEYRALLERWQWPTKGPAEIEEARRFIQQECPPRRPGERRP